MSRQALADAVPFWWHSIELGEGAVSRGRKTPEIHAGELAAMRLPDLRGKTVLDVGAWDGFYSFHAEERGAARVVALDHDMWRLHGRRGFELAHRLRESRVEPVDADFMTMDLEALGRFDIVLFLGVLYHLEDPLGALRRLRLLTGELAVVETHGVRVPDFEHHALWELYPADELADDPSNWWGPNALGLVGACRAAGFEHVEIVSTERREETDDLVHGRLIAHARPGTPSGAAPTVPAEAPTPRPRAQLRDARADLESARVELANASADAATAWRELDVVYASRSWRLTAPLRAAIEALRRVRRRRRA